MFKHQSINKTFGSLDKVSNKSELAKMEREDELLEIAESIMQKEGFSGLTMDKLVFTCAYSKGTVYNHFNSKEDLLCALCIKSMRLTLALFKKAKTFSGTSREKILAIHYAYRLHALKFPTLFLCVLTSQTPAVREKADPERLALQLSLDTEMTNYCDNMFVLAQKLGDISVEVDINQLTFASWALSFGSNALLTLSNDVQGIQRLDADPALLNNINLLMDGMLWAPLSRDWDYHKSWQRIGLELFKQENDDLLKHPGVTLEKRNLC